MKKFLSIIALLGIGIQAMAIGSIGIIAPDGVLKNTITALALSDVQALLIKACNCRVDVGNNTAEVVLILPKIDTANIPPSRFQKAATVPYFPFPDHDFQWTVKSSPLQTSVILSAKSFQGISFALYALLQEKLGFKFYHPRETIVPTITTWPLNQPMTFEGTALFDKKGFHLHTQHPLELTEQLHNPTLPHALDDIKEYIDWLVRNGQNYFEFCLLEGIGHNKWIAHAKAMTDYAHARGILIGVDMSLHTIQQRTFKLYNSGHSYETKEKQVDKNLAWLSQAKWDFFSMEFNTAEFIGGNKAEREKLRLHIVDWVQKNTHTKLVGRKHIVQDKAEVMTKGEQFVMDSTQQALDKQRGLLVHTVMCYDMTEPHAPVYENENQRHMFQLLKDEMKVRETWYYPESAYWISFDNSIPMLLLPYLSSRLSDIDTCVKYNVPGHITFSSGWEWGYWLIDWSIARWSWEYKTNGMAPARTPMDRVQDLFQNQEVTQLMHKELGFQQRYLKDSSLMKFMTGMNATDELPFFNKQFEPRPDDSYKHIRRKISLDKVQQYRKVLPQLQAFADSSINGVTKLQELIPQQNQVLSRLLNELTTTCLVTATRAIHRKATLGYLLSMRERKLTHHGKKPKELLAAAAKNRTDILEIVARMEKQYRYPVPSLSYRHKSYTAYAFGYLYPVHILYFWKREELQAKHNRWNALYHNMYDLLKIVGVKK